MYSTSMGQGGGKDYFHNKKYFMAPNAERIRFTVQRSSVPISKETFNIISAITESIRKKNVRKKLRRKLRIYFVGRI